MKTKFIIAQILGYFFLLLGVLGAFVPLLPTTPFVLISMSFFSVNPKINEKIMKISFFKEHMLNYKEKTGLSIKTYLISILFLFLTLIISILKAKNNKLKFLFVVVFGIITLHITHIARLKNKFSN